MARKPKKYHYIYKTTCKVTGKFYVGMHSSDSLDDGYLGSGKILGYSRKKYGDENHVREILEFCSSRDELKQREKEVVNEELLANPLNINLKYGGEGGSIDGWGTLKPETRKRAAQKGNASYLLKHGGWWNNVNVKDKSISTRKNNPLGYNAHAVGKQLSEDHKKKISTANSIAQKGERNSQFGIKRAVINKDGIVKKVLRQELESYIKNGWHLGFKSQ